MGRILITREHAEPLGSLIGEVGHDVVHVPLFTLEGTGAEMPGWRPDAVLVTSAATARFASGLSMVAAGADVFAVGLATADALAGVGISASSIGSGGGAEALELMLARGYRRCLYVGAAVPSAGLDAALSEARVERWAVYRNQRAPGAESELRNAEFDLVTFTSGSAVEAFVDAVGPPGVPAVVLGPSTRAAADARGVAVAAVASEPTLEALADAVRRLA